MIAVLFICLAHFTKKRTMNLLEILTQDVPETMTPTAIVFLVLMVAFAWGWIMAVGRRRRCDREIADLDSQLRESEVAVRRESNGRQWSQGKLDAIENHLDHLQEENNWLREAVTKTKPNVTDEQ